MTAVADRAAMRSICVCLLLLAPALAEDDPVDRLFHKDPAVRAAARAELEKLGDGALEKVLHGIEKRQVGPNVIRVYDLADFKADENWWAFAVGRVRATAKAGTVMVLAQRGTLLVLAPASAHVRVAADLASMRKKLALMISVEVRVVRTKKPTEPVAAVNDLAAFLERVGGTILTAPRLTARNGGRATVSTVKQTSYVSDFEIEVAQGTVIADPTIDTITDGVIIDVRAVAAGNVVHVAIDARLRETEKNIPRMKLPMPLGPGVEIQVPQSTSRGVRRLVRCKPGFHTVVRIDATTLLLVKAEQS